MCRIWIQKDPHFTPRIGSGSKFSPKVRPRSKRNGSRSVFFVVGSDSHFTNVQIKIFESDPDPIFLRVGPGTHFFESKHPNPHFWNTDPKHCFSKIQGGFPKALTCQTTRWYSATCVLHAYNHIPPVLQIQITAVNESGTVFFFFFL